VTSYAVINAPRRPKNGQP